MSRRAERLQSVGRADLISSCPRRSAPSIDRLHGRSAPRAGWGRSDAACARFRRFRRSPPRWRLAGDPLRESARGDASGRPVAMGFAGLACERGVALMRGAKSSVVFECRATAAFTPPTSRLRCAASSKAYARSWGSAEWRPPSRRPLAGRVVVAVGEYLAPLGSGELTTGDFASAVIPG